MTSDDTEPHETFPATCRACDWWETRGQRDRRGRQFGFCWAFGVDTIAAEMCTCWNLSREVMERTVRHD